MQATTRRIFFRISASGLAIAVLLGIAPAADAAEVSKLAILVPEEGTDFGWNQQGVDAAKAVAEKYGLEFLPAQGLGYGDVRPTLRELAGEGASLMIAHASGYNTAAPEIAAETNVPVAIVDRPDALKPGLIADYTLSGHEGAYLAGRLAAKTTTTGTVGIVVSGEPPSWNSQSAGFAEGVKAEKPETKIVYAVIGPAAYADAAGGRRVTESVISAGADVIFGQGNGSSFGMIQAVETTKAPNGGKVWFIDVIGDKSSIDEQGVLLSSVLWDFSDAFTQAAADVEAGTFGTEGYFLDVANGGIGLLETDLWTEEGRAAVEAAKAGIADGSIVLPDITDEEGYNALIAEG